MAKGGSGPCSRQPRARGRRYACEYGRSVARRRQGGARRRVLVTADEAAPMGGGRARPPLPVTRFNLVHGSRVPGGRTGVVCAATGACPPPEPGGVVPLRRARRRARSPSCPICAEGAGSGPFTPERVRRRRIPKAGGKVRSLGIPAMADRIVRASLKLVPEPIFEADFHPSSYGAGRRAQDAIAQIHELTSRPADYEWVFEADTRARPTGRTALMGRVRERVGDKRILALIRGLSEAGVLSEDGAGREDPGPAPRKVGSRVCAAGQYRPIRPGLALPTQMGRTGSGPGSARSTGAAGAR